MVAPDFRPLWNLARDGLFRRLGVAKIMAEAALVGLDMAFRQVPSSIAYATHSAIFRLAPLCD